VGVWLMYSVWYWFWYGFTGCCVAVGKFGIRMQELVFDRDMLRMWGVNMENKAGKDILPKDWIEMEAYVSGLELVVGKVRKAVADHKKYCSFRCVNCEVVEALEGLNNA